MKYQHSSKEGNQQFVEMIQNNELMSFSLRMQVLNSFRH